MVKPPTESDSRMTARSAAACENATSPPSACRCRCGGAKHGAARGAVRALPAGDPHCPDDEDPKERRKRVAAERAKARYDAIMRALRPPEDT